MIFWIFHISQKHAWYESHFSGKRGVKITFLFFYPSAKGCNELKIGEIVVTFEDASAHYAQKLVAPPKLWKCVNFLSLFEAVKIWHQFFSWVFCRRKMKCGESSETRFGKVWSRSEPSLRGKRPFKVSMFFFEISRNRLFLGRFRSFFGLTYDTKGPNW